LVPSITRHLFLQGEFSVMALRSLQDDQPSVDVQRKPFDDLDRLTRHLAAVVESWSRIPALLNARTRFLAETDDRHLALATGKKNSVSASSAALKGLTADQSHSRGAGKLSIFAQPCSRVGTLWLP